MNLRLATAALGCMALTLTACGGNAAEAPTTGSSSSTPTAETPTPGTETSRAVTPSAESPSAEATAPRATSATSTPSAKPRKPKRRPKIEHVVLVSVDALAPAVFDRIPASQVPNFTRIIEGGISTMNARTAVEQNVTLPNHVGMVTGRGITRRDGGHGVTYNDDPRGDTLQQSSGDPGIETVFDVVHDAGGTTALFTGKAKFNIFKDSDPAALDTFVVNGNEGALAAEAARTIAAQQPTFTMVHLAQPDVAGHEKGGLSPAYLAAVRQADADLGVVLAAVQQADGWRSTRLILTADHGVGQGQKHHSDRIPANYTVPFVVYGARVGTGDLYRANPSFADPGTGRPNWQDAQPVRNLDAANLATRSLRLGKVPGSYQRPKLRVGRNTEMP